VCARCIVISLLGRKRLGFTKRLGDSNCIRVQNFFLDPEDQVGLTFTCFVLAWAIGSIVIAYVEPITVIDSVYFMFSILTTVGFGDIVCSHTMCRVTVLVLVGLPLRRPRGTPQTLQPTPSRLTPHYSTARLTPRR